MKYFVYCLYKDNDLQYVGSTTQIVTRIKSHKRDKDFNSVKYCVLESRTEMLDFEIVCINEMSPPLNRTKPPIPKDFTGLVVNWRQANLDFLKEVPTTHSFDDFCFEAYQKHIIKRLNLPWSLVYNVLHHWSAYDWTYDFKDGYLMVKHDSTGKSFHDLVVEMGCKSYNELRRDLEIINNITSYEEYEKSLKQFD